MQIDQIRLTIRNPLQIEAFCSGEPKVERGERIATSGQAFTTVKKVATMA